MLSVSVLLLDAPAFADLAQLNDWLEARCQALWHEVLHPEQHHRTVAEVFDDEQNALMAMPPPFDGFVELTKRVTPTCLIVFERNRDGGDREMADILALVLHHDEQLVEQAVSEAIKSDVISKTHILNRLSRLLDAPPPEALQPRIWPNRDHPRLSSPVSCSTSSSRPKWLNARCAPSTTR